MRNGVENTDNINWKNMTEETKQANENLISVASVWADQSRGWGVWIPSCIKIGFCQPTRAESREGSSLQAESSRVTKWRLGWRNARFWLADDSGDVMLDSDWLTRAEGSRVLDSDWLTKLIGSRFWLADNSSDVTLNSDWPPRVLARRVGNVLKHGAESRVNVSR